MLGAQVWNQFVDSLPTLVGAILLLILAFVVAYIVKGLITKVLSSDSIKPKLDKFNGEGKMSLIDMIAKAAFLLVFILFLPPVLNKLNISGVSEPITGFVTKIINYIPLLLAAGILLYIGFFVANIVREILSSLLERFGANKLQNKYAPVKEENAKLSNVLASIVYVLILVPVVIAALDILNLQAIAQPASEMFNSIISYIPKVFVSGLLIYVGIFLANIIVSLLEGILVGTKVDELPKELNIKTNFNLSHVIAQVVKYVIIIFFTLEALKVLDLPVLTSIGVAVVTYIPYVISALLILLGAVILANWAEKILNTNKALSVLLKGLIYGIAVVMMLSQLGIASNIVEYGFIIVLAGASLAFALAFGLGGRDFANKKLKEVERKASSSNQVSDKNLDNK